jgi:hypothetical protein
VLTQEGLPLEGTESPILQREAAFVNAAPQ